MRSRNASTAARAILALALAGTVAGAPASAQEASRTVSLDEAVRLLHENSPEMALARSRIREARGLARQAAAFPNPSVIATHESLDGDGPGQSETYLNLSQRLEWPGRRGARARAAERDLDATRAGFRADSARLVFEVRRAYLEAAAADERLRVLEQVSAVFRDATGRAEARFADGDVSRYARDRIRLESAHYERALTSARVELEAARRALGALILPGADGVPMTEGLPMTLPPEAPPGGALSDAMERHPAVEAARAAVEAARAESDLARALRIPDPTVTGGYKTQSNGYDGVYLGISLPLPFLDRKGGAIDAAEARLEFDRSRLDLTRRSVERELRRAAARYQAMRAQAGSLASAIGAAGAGILETARVAYREGEMQLVELLDAAAARRDAGILTTDLRADAWTSYYELIRASGGAVAATRSEGEDR